MWTSTTSANIVRQLAHRSRKYGATTRFHSGHAASEVTSTFRDSTITQET